MNGIKLFSFAVKIYFYFSTPFNKWSGNMYSNLINGRYLLVADYLCNEKTRRGKYTIRVIDKVIDGYKSFLSEEDERATVFISETKGQSLFCLYRHLVKGNRFIKER